MTTPGSHKVDRSCPNCGKTNRQNYTVQAKQQAEDLDFGALRESWSGFFKERAFFSYGRCTECDLLYCPQFFSQGALDSLYRSMADNTAGVPLDAILKTNRSYLDLLMKSASLEGAYLEFGPDLGLLAQMASQVGRMSSFTFIEPNQAIHARLRENLASASTSIFSDESALENIPDHSVSLIVMIHVVDHLLNPVSLLKRLSSKLVPGGTVFVVTHDESSFLARGLGRRWPGYCLQHPQLFQPRTLEGLLRTCGMDPVRTERTYNYFPVFYLLKHLLYSLGLSWIPLPRLDALQIGVKLGNIACIARKRNEV